MRVVELPVAVAPATWVHDPDFRSSVRHRE
jgi:hypothetical protein